MVQERAFKLWAAKLAWGAGMEKVKALQGFIFEESNVD